MRNDEPSAGGAHLGEPIRPHWKILIWPLTKATLLLAAELAVLVMLDFGHGHPGAPVLLAIVAVAGLAWWVVWPLLEWRSTTYMVTRARLRKRWWIPTPGEEDYSMSRLIDVHLEMTLLDQLFDAGTLVLEFPGKHGEVKIKDIPHVRDWNSLVNQLAWPDPEHDQDLSRRPGGHLRGLSVRRSHDRGNAAA